MRSERGDPFKSMIMKGNKVDTFEGVDDGDTGRHSEREGVYSYVG